MPRKQSKARRNQKKQAKQPQRSVAASRSRKQPQQRSKRSRPSSGSRVVSLAPTHDQLAAIDFLIDADGDNLPQSAPALAAHGITMGDTPAPQRYVPVQAGGLAHDVMHLRSLHNQITVPAGQEVVVLSCSHVDATGNMVLAVYSVHAIDTPLDDAGRVWTSLTAPQDGGLDDDSLLRVLSGVLKVTHDLPLTSNPPTLNAGRFVGESYLIPGGPHITSYGAYQDPSVTPAQFIASCPQHFSYLGSPYEHGGKVLFVGPLPGAPRGTVAGMTWQDATDNWVTAQPAANFETAAAALPALMLLRNTDANSITVYVDALGSVARHDLSTPENNEHLPGLDPMALQTFQHIYHAPAFAGPNSFLSFLKSVGRALVKPINWAGGVIKDFVRSGKAKDAVSSALTAASTGGARAGLAAAAGSLLGGRAQAQAAPPAVYNPGLD